MNAEIVATHNAGFFSCCSVKLTQIVDFFNIHKRLPNRVCGASQFDYYKSDSNQNLTNLYFQENSLNINYTENIAFHWDYQFVNFKDINYTNLQPFIAKYFEPSLHVRQLVEKSIEKYNIDFSNTVAVCYRGGDKKNETNIASYEEFFKQCQIIENKYPNKRFFIQSDETEFIQEFQSNFSNSFYIKEIPSISRHNNGVVHHTIPQDNKNLFGSLILHSILLLSKCMYVVTHSGNVGLWIMLYRGNSDNTSQYLHLTKIYQDFLYKYKDVCGWI